MKHTSKSARRKLAAALCAVALFAGACSSDKEEAAKDTTTTGVVTEAAMNSLVIEAPDGTTYSFSKDDDTKFSGDGLLLGDTVEVQYKGEYEKGMPADSITITKKADSADDSKTDDTKDSSTESQNSSSGQKSPDSDLQNKDHVQPAGYFSGTVVDATMNAVVVDAGDGQTVTFKKDGSTSVVGDLVIGAVVNVAYSGDLAANPTALDITISQPDQPDMSSVVGIVQDGTMNSIVIDADGTSYSFAVDENTHADSYQIGDEVEITYEGSYTEGIPATLVLVTQSN